MPHADMPDISDYCAHSPAIRLLIIINAVFILIFIGIACVLCFGGIELKTEGSASVLMSAFGVMITLLVGWQVFNAIEMRTAIDKVDKINSELDRLATIHQDKISRLEWLTSALHGTTFDRNGFQGGDTAYFIHCLDVIGDFIKSGVPLDNPPFRNIIDAMDSTFQDIRKRNNSHEIIVLGGYKDFVKHWYHKAISLTDAESEHLKEIKARLSKIYEDFIILTKDVVIKPHVN